MHIVFCEPPTLRVQGDQVHRTRAPAAALAARGHRVLTGSYLSPRIQSAMQEADVAVLVQSVDVDFAPLIARRRAEGRTTLVEINDDFTEPRSFGEVGSFYHQPRIRALLLELASMADGLMTSTHELARRFGAGHPRTSVVPNAAPPRMARAARSDASVRLGWAGSMGHAHDWPSFVPALAQLLRQRPSLRFYVMAPAALRKVFAPLPAAQVVWEAPRDFAGYMEFLATLDVGLAPLGDSAFARGRSDVKWLEYTQAGVASVVSAGPAYEEVADGQTGLVVSSPEALVAAAARLLDDEAMRAELVGRSQIWVAKHRTPDALAARREALMLAATPAGPHRPPRRAELWPASLEHVAFGPAEHQLIAGLKQQAAPKAAYPHFAEAARLAPLAYLPHLYAARAAPSPALARSHRHHAQLRAPQSLAARLLEVEELAQRRAWPEVQRVVVALMLQFGPETLLWHQLAVALGAQGHHAGAAFAWQRCARGWPHCPTSHGSLAYAHIAWLEDYLAHDAAGACRAAAEASESLNSAISLAQRGAALSLWEAQVLRARLHIVAQKAQAAMMLLAPALRAPDAQLAEVRPALALLAQQALALGNTRAAQAALARLQLDVRAATATVS